MRDVPKSDGSEPLREPPSLVRFAGLVLDVDARTLERESGEAIRLTRGEFALLRVFVTRPGRVVSRDALLDALANRRFEPFDRSVDSLIVRLRRKIEPDPKAPRLIVTARGEGYRFDGLRFNPPQIAKLADADSVSRPEATPIGARASEGARPPAEAASRAAERRHITALAAELVWAEGDSPNDPEDLRLVIDTFRRIATEALSRYGATIAEGRGREIAAYFGHRQAQENDAENAVRAALAIQRAQSENYAHGAGGRAPQCAARIGLDSGLVVVDAIGEVFGDAPNVAARVQALADPGTVLITARVQRQVGGLFIVEDRGAHALKGSREPTTLFQIVRASGGRRFGARALTPLVGREEELDLLRRRWERAATGEGQFFHIVGEPGIGKSRLVAEFRLKLGETPHTFVEWSSSQLLQNTPLHPIAEWGRQRFGADAPAARRLADLENTLRLIGLDPAEYAPLLAPQVDIPLPDERAAKLAPEELRRRQLAALTTWVLAGARSQPMVLAFEDLQWADPTSIDLICALAERGGQAPLLLLVTSRPEFRQPWGLRSHHGVISLGPLGRAEVSRMVGEIAAHHALAKDMIDGVIERTGGVPLFVEEVTRLLLERGEAGGLQAIPLTLQQSLAARLDRLGDAREVAQIGAVLGREFSYALLRALGGIDDPAFQSALDRLADADLLISEGAGSQAKYRFKHALIQHAAYESLLKSRRRALHRSAAEILRDEPERAKAEPEVIAHHFTEAGLDELAIEWWGKAGDQALRRSAFHEAIAHLGKAIAMADKMDSGEMAGIPGERRKLHVAYGNALIATRGYSAAETREAFAKAHEPAFGDKEAPEQLAADFGLWAASSLRGELPAMRAHAAAFLRDVEVSPDSPQACVAHRAAGITHWFAGEYAEAREHLERALALFKPGRDDDLAFRFGHDAGVAAALYLALTLWPLGDVGYAASLLRSAKARIATLAYIGTRAYGSVQATLFELMLGDRSRAASNAAEFARITREHDLPFWRAFGVFLDGLASTQSRTAGGGLEDMRHGLELLREQNALLFDGLLKIALAEAEARTGNIDRALTILDEALTTCDRIGHRSFEAELHRVRGEILLTRSPTNSGRAEEAFLTAISVSEQQGTRTFKLRAALSLAKLYQSTARLAEAHAVLAPAVEGMLSLLRRARDDGLAGSGTLTFDPSPKQGRHKADAAALPEIVEAQALLLVTASALSVSSRNGIKLGRVQRGPKAR